MSEIISGIRAPLLIVASFCLGSLFLAEIGRAGTVLNVVVSSSSEDVEQATIFLEENHSSSPATLISRSEIEKIEVPWEGVLQVEIERPARLEIRTETQWCVSAEIQPGEPTGLPVACDLVDAGSVQGSVELAEGRQAPPFAQLEFLTFGAARPKDAKNWAYVLWAKRQRRTDDRGPGARRLGFIRECDLAAAYLC